MLRLIGTGIRPWAVPVRALTRALDAVQQLIEPSEEELADAVEEEEPDHIVAPLHLIGIVSRSAGYKVAAQDPEKALATLAETGRWLSNPGSDEWGVELLSPIRELSSIARSLSCTIEFTSPDGTLLAVVDTNSYNALAATAFVVSESSVYGRLERVGGATESRCAIRLPTQPRKMVYCTVETPDLVRQLGQHIYENVLLTGTVKWFRKTWAARSVQVKGFQPAKRGSILVALHEIYEAGGKVWDEIDDPQGLISEMRGQ